MTRKDNALFVVLVAGLALLLAPVLLRPGATFFNHGDLYTYHAPLRSVTASALQEGRIPFWNPFILFGVPHAANPQAALFYPPALASSFWLPVRALAFDHAFHLLWAMIGAFLLARAQGLRRAGAVALAGAFALSPFLVYRVTAGIPTLLAALSWMPWLWLAWLRGPRGLLAAALALQLFSGHGQFLIVNLGAMGLWALARDGRIEAFGRLAAEGIAALALSAVQWLPTAEFLRRSNRSDWPEIFNGAYSLEPRHLAAWLWPGALGTPLAGTWHDAISIFYETCGATLGPAALALAAVGLARSKRRAPALVLLGAGLLLALGANGPLWPLLSSAPALSYLRTPSRWALLCLWGAWLAAGAGWRALDGGLTPARRGILFALVLAPLFAWDALFLRAEDPDLFLAPNRGVAARLGGRDSRVVTDPGIANPNKTALYRLRNANGYDAFFPKGTAEYAARAEGAPAADASRVYLSRWRAPELERAGVAARLGAGGIEESARAWPPAFFVDAAGARVRPDPRVAMPRPGRWLVSGVAPAGAAGVALTEPRDPGWRATLDGRRVALEAWDGFFQAARLPAGAAGREASLRFDFAPPLWTLWAALSLAAWSSWLLLRARAGGLS